MSSTDGVASEIAIPLTGRFSFRRSLRGKLVLRVEENVRSGWPWSRGEWRTRWRDANLMDLASPEMRALMDLRSRPQYMAQRYLGATDPLASPGDAAQAIDPAGLMTGPAPQRAWDTVRSAH